MRKHVIPLLKFGLVGTVNTGIDFLIFSLLTVWGWSYLPAQSVSYASGVLNSYVMNRSWTFRESSGASRFTFLKFIALNLLVLLLTIGSIALLHQGAGLPVLAAKMFATALGVIANFTGSRMWVFRQRQTV